MASLPKFNARLLYIISMLYTGSE